MCLLLKADSQSVKILIVFMKPEGPVPHLQLSATGPDSGPNTISLRPVFLRPTIGLTFFSHLPLDKLTLQLTG